VFFGRDSLDFVIQVIGGAVIVIGGSGFNCFELGPRLTGLLNSIMSDSKSESESESESKWLADSRDGIESEPELDVGVMVDRDLVREAP